MKIDTTPTSRSDESHELPVPQTEAEKWKELEELNKQTGRVTVESREELVLTWDKGRGFRVNGSSVRMSAIVLGMLSTYCFTLYSGFRPTDAIAPMALQGIIGGAITYIDRRKST